MKFKQPEHVARESMTPVLVKAGLSRVYRQKKVIPESIIYTRGHTVCKSLNKQNRKLKKKKITDEFE